MLEGFLITICFNETDDRTKKAQMYVPGFYIQRVASQQVQNRHLEFQWLFTWVSAFSDRYNITLIMTGLKFFFPIFGRLRIMHIIRNCRSNLEDESSDGGLVNANACCRPPDDEVATPPEVFIGPPTTTRARCSTYQFHSLSVSEISFFSLRTPVSSLAGG